MGDITARTELRGHYEHQLRRLPDLRTKVLVNSVAPCSLELLEGIHLIKIVAKVIKTPCIEGIRICFERDFTRDPTAQYCFLMDDLYKQDYPGRALLMDVHECCLYIRFDKWIEPTKH